MEKGNSTLEKIHQLELRLLDPVVRASPDKLSRLLADDFVEFGSSGRVYDKQRVIDSLQGETGVRFSVEEFQARPIAPGVVLATYQVTRYSTGEDGTRTSLRCSIWRKDYGTWQMVFHQGTFVESI